MKRITTALLALSMLLALPSQAFAYALNSIGPFPRDSGPYHYYVEVCLDANTGSSTWNTGAYAFHARLSSAMAAWNAINGELRFAASNSCVWGIETAILARWENLGSGGPKAQMHYTTNHGCAEPWGINCHLTGTLKINNYYVWYLGTGTPSNAYDIQSAFTHELGHFEDAPDISGADCNSPTVSLRETMCGTLTLNETWKRSLATEDITSYEARFGTNP